MNYNIKNKKEMYFIYTVCESKKDARKLGKLLISKKKAVCINIIDNTLSIYEEKNNIIETKECILIIKTLLKSNEIFKFINKNHKYKTPFIAHIKIKKTNGNYMDWAKKKLNK
tara:strand:+ start:254 stop:592 length:339 start_codon:yes stop_codon:yes gene_type:complete